MTAPWKKYVATLCSNAWDLDAEATQNVLRKIEALVTARVLTDPAVAQILLGVGVAEAAADQIAPSIRVAIRT